MWDPTLEQSDPFFNLTLDREVRIEQDLANNLCRVERLVSIMDRTIMEEGERRKRFENLFSSLRYYVEHCIKSAEKKKEEFKETNPLLYTLAHKLSFKLEKLKGVASKSEFKDMKLEMMSVYSQQRIERLQESLWQAEQRSRRG